MSEIAEIGHNSALPAYKAFIGQLDDLRASNDAAKFEYDTPNGNRDARSHVYKLRQFKSEIEKARVAEKAESLKHGKLVDEQANALKDQLDGMIEVHDSWIKDIENREKERVSKLEAKFSELKSIGQAAAECWMNYDLDMLKEWLANTEAQPLGEEHWEEYARAAAEAKDASLIQIREAIGKRETQLSEQAELERLRTEADARAQADRDEELRKEGERAAAAQAESNAEADRAAAAKRESDLLLEAETAKREKAEAETRAANAEKEAAAKAVREAEETAEREKAEAEKREANKAHNKKINKAALEAFVKGGLDIESAKTAIVLIATRKIPNIQINY